MTTATDVKAKYLSASGNMGVGSRIRVKGVYVQPGATAGTVSFKVGNSSGTELILLGTPANTTASTFNVLIPSDGVLFEGDPYVTLTNVTSVTIFYG